MAAGFFLEHCHTIVLVFLLLFLTLLFCCVVLTPKAVTPALSFSDVVQYNADDDEQVNIRIRTDPKRIHLIKSPTKSERSVESGPSVESGASKQSRPSVDSGPSTQSRPSVDSGRSIPPRLADIGPSMKSRPSVDSGRSIESRPSSEPGRSIPRTSGPELSTLPRPSVDLELSVPGSSIEVECFIEPRPSVRSEPDRTGEYKASSVKNNYALIFHPIQVNFLCT